MQIQRKLYVNCNIEDTIRQVIQHDTFIQATVYVSETIPDSQFQQCDRLALSIIFIRKIVSKGQTIR